MTIKIEKLDYHRNGICGEGFHVAIAKDGKQKMLIIRFPGECRCAVFDLALLCKETIEFGYNSWRGDHYVTDMDAAIKVRETKEMVQ